MKKTLIMLLCILMLTGCGSDRNNLTKPTESPIATPIETTTSEPTESTLPIDQIAVSYVEDLAAGNFKKAIEEYPYDKTMKKVLTESMLKNELWAFFTSTFGNYKEITGTLSSEKDNFRTISVRTSFEKGKLLINIVFDQQNTIAGINYAMDVPESAMPDAITETKLTFGKSGWELPAILTTPKEGSQFPVVILVHGSGANDKDESIAANKPFRDLAWGLAQKGIATLRYDKRNFAYAEKMAALPSATFFDETEEDAILAVAFLKSNPIIDPQKIYVLGHSLGGMLMPRIAAKTPDAAGYIILGGPVTPLNDIIIEQVHYLSQVDGSLSDEDKKMIEENLAMNANVKALTPDSKMAAGQLFGKGQSYWLDIQGYNPAETAKAIKKPLMIMQGERDYQVTPKELDLWKAALNGKPNVSFKLYDGLNHLFIKGTGTPSPDEYFIEGKVDQRVIDDISAFIP